MGEFIKVVKGLVAIGVFSGLLLNVFSKNQTIISLILCFYYFSMKKFLKILNAFYAIAPALLGLFTIYYGIYLAKQGESFIIIIGIIASGFTLMSFTGGEASSKTLNDLETITKRIETKIDCLIEQKNHNSSINQKVSSNKENQKIMKAQSLIKKEGLSTKRNTNNKTTNSKSNR